MKPLATLLVLFGFACAVTIALAQEEPEPAPQPKPEPAPKELTQVEKDALATRAYFVLRNRCWGCHGEPGKTAYGETVALDWILDYEKLVAAKLVIPGKVKESRLIYLTTLGKMPREFDEDGKPSKEGELPEAEQKALIEWVKAGAPKWPKLEYEMEWVPIGPGPHPLELEERAGQLFEGPTGLPSLIVSKWENTDELAMWKFESGRWTSAGPVPHSGNNMDYFGVRDAGGARTLFMASSLGFQMRATLAVYSWDGSGMRPNEPDSGPSSNLANYGLVTDIIGSRVVFFGGYTTRASDKGGNPVDTGPVNDTWAYTMGKFERLATAVAPPASRNPALGYDAAGKRVILLTTGKEKTETWQLVGSTWTKLSPLHNPALSEDHHKVFSRPVWDPESSRLVLHGPDVAQVETWCWSDGDWKLLTKAAPDASGTGASIAWDPGGKRMIYYQAGYGSQAGTETWALIPWRKAK